jgi:hypothetical protein
VGFSLYPGRNFFVNLQGSFSGEPNILVFEPEVPKKGAMHG